MDLLYFLFLGIIFTLMTLDNNNALKSKNLLSYKDKKASGFKIFFDILISWFFAGNALFFLYLSFSFTNNYMRNFPVFIKNIILLVNFINVFVMPFLLFKRVVIRDKSKQ